MELKDIANMGFDDLQWYFVIVMHHMPSLSLVSFLGFSSCLSTDHNFSTGTLFFSQHLELCMQDRDPQSFVSKG